MDTENMEKALELFSRYARAMERKTRLIPHLELFRDGSGKLVDGEDKEVLSFHNFTELATGLSEHILEEWEKSDY